MSDQPAVLLREVAAVLRTTATQDEFHTRAGGTVQGSYSLRWPGCLPGRCRQQDQH